MPVPFVIGGYEYNGSRSGLTTARDILDNYKDVGDDNDILKRARFMLTVATNMHGFTRSDGKIKTTQDFFTQAEIFTEECNRLYKLIRMFPTLFPPARTREF